MWQNAADPEQMWQNAADPEQMWQNAAGPEQVWQNLVSDQVLIPLLTIKGFSVKINIAC